MDVKSHHVDPVKEDFLTSGVSLAAEIKNALALLSISAPPLKDHKASVVENIKEGEEIFSQKEESMVVNLASNLEFGENEELKNSKFLEEDEKKKIPEVDVDEKFALQSSSKLVSAMKGSRKKQGPSAEKLSVSWAADVYDPPVTSQSHSMTNDYQNGSKSSKKSYSNKNKHKGKSSPKSNNKKKNGSKTSRNSSKVASY